MVSISISSSTGFSCHDRYLPLSNRFQSFILDSEHLLQHCPLHHTSRHVDIVYVRPCQDMQLGHVYVRPCQDVQLGQTREGQAVRQSARQSRDTTLHLLWYLWSILRCDISGQSYTSYSLGTYGSVREGCWGLRLSSGRKRICRIKILLLTSLTPYHWAKPAHKLSCGRPRWPLIQGFGALTYTCQHQVISPVSGK